MFLVETPPTWTPMPPGATCELVDLPPGNVEYQEVKEAFIKSLPKPGEVSSDGAKWNHFHFWRTFVTKRFLFCFKKVNNFHLRS